jgi:hypothetical protein
MNANIGGFLGTWRLGAMSWKESCNGHVSNAGAMVSLVNEISYEFTFGFPSIQPLYFEGQKNPENAHGSMYNVQGGGHFYT